MLEGLPIQLVGKIFWLPPHKPEKLPFPPDTIFRALAKFTADFTPSYTVLISYSSAVNEKGFHEVKINIPFGKDEEIQDLVKNTEMLIMDGYKVIAVCRQLFINPIIGKSMGDSWDSSEK